MDPLSILYSLNKISLIAFLITFVFIAYQIYIFKKELTTRRNKPNIPAFNEGAATASSYTKVIINQSDINSYKKPNRIPIMVGILFMVIFGVIFLIGIINRKNENSSTEAKLSLTPIINLMASKGIMIFDKNWTPLTDSQLATLSAGHSIYIGVETINDVDIDRARIRINSKEWKTDALTLNLNKQKNVYYREYTISSGTASLKIEAQLHSATDGWLGD